MQLGDIQAAAKRIEGGIVRTPCQRSATLSNLFGAHVFIKCENQQFTASFKERGALNCLLSMNEQVRRKGVIAMSAGNHAQAVACHGARLGVPTCIVMPRSTPNAKVEQTRVFGAEIHLEGAQFDETLEFTKHLAASRGLTLVHPFDDERVIAGQGTVGLEIIAQHGDVEVVLVPIGGGGLIGGTALAIKALAPKVEVIGVQMERFSAAADRYHGRSYEPKVLGTVAEGIAVKSPGARTWPLIEAFVDDVLTVTEQDVEQAIFTLLEIEKTLVEGAGAAALAALAANRERFAGRRVVLVLSGGNIDMMILSSVLQRGLVRTRRLIRLAVEIPDVPGALSELTRVLGELDSNIVEIAHQRAFGGSSVRATVVELTLQMRGEEQVDQVLAALAARGYEARLRST
jgi:threonine dehydratase